MTYISDQSCAREFAAHRPDGSRAHELQPGKQNVAPSKDNQSARRYSWLGGLCYDCLVVVLSGWHEILSE